MDLITCPHCLYSFEPTPGMRPPPWCRRCGGDLNARPIGAARPGEPAEELVALTAADAAPRGGSRWGGRPAKSATVAQPPRTATDTPAPAGGRWANRAKPSARPPAEDTFDYEAAVRAAGFESTRPSITCYLFAGVCVLIPLVSLGGAVPCALGFGGASACVKVAHSHGKSLPARLLACLGITGLVWGLFITLLVVAFKVGDRMAAGR